MSITFKPPQSLLPFFISKKFITLQMGPVGSCKTSAGIIKIAHHAAQMHPCADGIRRSRAVWVRNCFDKETEILTENGWKLFKDLGEKERVATLHGDELVFETPTYNYAAPYKGKMISVQNQGVDLLVTPDHELWVSERKGRAKVWQGYEHRKAMEVYGKGETLRMRSTASNMAAGTEYSTDFYEFLGFWFADGSAGVYETGGRLRYRLTITQKPREDKYVEKLFEKNGLPYTIVKKTDSDCLDYKLRIGEQWQKELIAEFATYGKARTKCVPRKYIEGVSQKQAAAFIYGYQQGDGIFKHTAHQKNTLRTSSKQLADDLHELAVLAGYMAGVRYYDHTDGYSHTDGYERVGWYEVTLFTEGKHRPRIAKQHWGTVENYKGMVYCVEVSSHVVLVRRGGKAIWCGQTRQVLWDTSIPDFLKWFPEGLAGTLMRTEMKFKLCFNDVECEVLFRGLDDANDVRRLLSLQASFAIFDEFREINPEVFSAMQGRLGRYPDKMLVPPIPGVHSGGCIREDGTLAKQVWGMSNPPDADTFWEQYFGNPPENAVCFIQPSGISAEADWLHYLDPDYYENLMVSNSGDWVDVYVHAKFGKSLAGKPVFQDTFDPEYHVAKEELQPLPPRESASRPLIIGMDFGLTPACTVNQQNQLGQFLALDEITSEGMGIERFADTCLKPLLANKYPGYPVVIIGDPTGGEQRSQIDERRALEVLRSKGFTAVKAMTNNPQARIAAVENLFTGQVGGGKPRRLISPTCKKLITAYKSGYRYKKRTDGTLEAKPDKKSFYSHIADADQYAALHVNQSYGALVSGRAARREIVTQSLSAWT